MPAYSTSNTQDVCVDIFSYILSIIKHFLLALSSVTHAKLRARFWFKRRLGYALIQIYIPTIMLVVLSWMAFWIPQESIPARVALGSTTVLSIVTFTGSFRGSMPKVCYILRRIPLNVRAINVCSNFLSLDETLVCDHSNESY